MTQTLAATFHLTHQCNLRCTYCYTGTKVHRPMSREVALKSLHFVLDEARKAQVKYLDITFFGGEPLIEAELLFWLADSFQEKLPAGMTLSFRLSTNGTLLTESMMHALANRDIYVSLSVDGVPEIQDAQRPNAAGKGSSAAIEKTIPILPRSLLHELTREKEGDEKVLEQYITEQQNWLAQNPEKSSNVTNVLAELKDPYFMDAKVKTGLQALFQKYNPNWKEVLWDIRDQFQNSRFSLAEIKELDYWAKEKELFLAPISFDDDRFKYYFTEKELLKNEALSKDSTELQRAKMMTKEAALNVWKKTCACTFVGQKARVNIEF